MRNSVKKESFACRLTTLKDHDERGITNEGIAKIAAGRRPPVSKQAVTKWFDGRSVPDPDSLANIARYFGVTKEWLYFGGSSPRRPASIDIAMGVDLLPEEDQREVAKDIARRLDGVEDIKLGGEHDSFVNGLRAAADALKKHVKPPS